MNYYFNTVLANSTFSETLEKTRMALKQEGFGILTEINIRAVLKEKLDVEFPNYYILGACNPPFAHKALLAEDKIGTMLPCNVIVRENSDQSTEVAVVDPVASMTSVKNEALEDIATEVRDKLKKVLTYL